MSLAALLTVLGISFLAAAGCTGAASRPPSVVLIVVDTLRFDHLGAYGYDQGTSPSLDALAREGVVVERAYAAAPWTRPSVASILTGLHARRHGANAIDRPLSDDIATLAEVFSARGYRTGGVVSNVHLTREFGFAQGFDEFFESEARGHQHISSTAVTEQAKALLSEFASGDEAFFLLVHYFDPHFQYIDHPEIARAPALRGKLSGSESMNELKKLAPRLNLVELANLIGRYDEEIQVTDAGIGDLLTSLESHGIAGETIVAFTADHGEELRDHGSIGHSTLYDEVLRVPLIIRAPGLEARRIEGPVSLVSLAPTLLDLAGQEHAPMSSDGESFAAALQGEALQERTLFAEGIDLAGAIRGPYKFVRSARPARTELYNLSRDPLERKNLLKRKTDVALDLSLALKNFDLENPRKQSLEKEIDPQQREMLRQLGYVDDEDESEALSPQ